MKQKFLPIIALLLMAVSGAWAQEETLLTTITATDKDSYSETTAGVVTVTHDNSYFYGEYGWLWYQAGSLTVEAKEGYTITKCVFRQAKKSPVTVSTAPFKVKFVETHPDYDPEMVTYLCEGADPMYEMDGVSTIEVYGFAPAPAATGYSVTLTEGTEDDANWKAKVGNGELQALPLTGLTGDETVTITYNGSKRVKSVTAVKKEAAPSVPDGTINGKFSVSATKQVYFSKGNLRYASGTWSFFDNQYDYYANYSADAWDHFGWSTSAPTYGMNTSTDNSTYSGDFVDWGATMGTGWFTLSSDEWTYLLKTRSASTVGGTENGRYAKAKVNDVQGVILFPDTYTHPDGVTAPVGVNETGNTGWNGNNYSSADWTKMESAGCVFLPAAGLRYDSSVLNKGTSGLYWSASSNGTDNAYCVNFGSVSLDTGSCSRGYGLSVRLVKDK